MEFEQRIKQNEINNPKFNFLNTGDPYHAYYQYKVDAIREGKIEPERPEKVKPDAAATTAVAHKQSELLKAAVKEDIVPKEPPPDFEFLADPPSISAFDLDVVKLTAQFVARNGRQFLTQLMNREQRNFQFDFLRPQHSLFQYFTKLLEQYTKVLIPPKDLQTKLDSEGNNKENVLEQVRYRVAWLKHQEANRRRQEEALERERVSYAQVDWHNFVVVETVDYQPWEVGNFPPPTNPNEVGARVLIQRRQEEHGSTAQPQPSFNDSDDSEDETGADTNVQDMEEGSSEEGSDDEGAPSSRMMKQQVMAAPPVQQPMVPPIQAPVPGNVTVRKYDPKAAAAIKKKSDDDQFLISPITGEKIPASKAAEHMKVGLLDPRWVEERDKQISQKQSEEVVYAPGQSIESSLKQYAERRTDIFGTGDDAAQETMIGKKIGEEEARPAERPGVWDGHSNTADSAARAAPPAPAPRPLVVALPAPAPAFAPVALAPVPPVAPMIVGMSAYPSYNCKLPIIFPNRCSHAPSDGCARARVRPAHGAAGRASRVHAAGSGSAVHDGRGRARFQEVPDRGESGARGRVPGAEPEPRHHEGGRAEHAGQARVEAGGPDAEHHPRPHRHRQHSQGPDHGRAWNAARETETSARIHILKGSNNNCFILMNQVAIL